MFSNDKIIFASKIGIKDESDIQSLQNKANWFYNICEVLEYTDIVGKRLAQISNNIHDGLKNEIDFNVSIEANSVLLMLLNLLDSFTDLFYYPSSKNKPCPQNEIEYQWKIKIPIKNPTVKLLNGLRNALVHRHPINMRNVRFLGIGKRMGVTLSPVEFNRYIHLSPRILENRDTRKQIKFIREEPFMSEFGLMDDWFAWDKGKTLCFLDCEDFGVGIAGFLFNLLSDVVKRNDDNIKDLLFLLRKIGNCDVYIPEKHTTYSIGAYHVTNPFINRLI